MIGSLSSVLRGHQKARKPRGWNPPPPRCCRYSRKPGANRVKMCKSAKVVKLLLISCEATFELWLTFQCKWTVFFITDSLQTLCYFHISSILFQKFNFKKMFCFENVTPGAQLTQQRPRVLQKNNIDSLKNTVHLY